MLLSHAKSPVSPPALQEMARPCVFARGDVLFRTGEESRGLYEVDEGQVSLSRVDIEGRAIVLHVTGPGDLLAEASIFSAVYNCDAQALTEVRARFYPKTALLRVLRNDTGAAEAFMAGLAQQVMALRTRLARRNIRSADGRILNYLAVGADSEGAIRLPGTLKDWAGELGLSHEALYRTLRQLQGRGLINRAGTTIALNKVPSI